MMLAIERKNDGSTLLMGWWKGPRPLMMASHDIKWLGQGKGRVSKGKA